LTFITAENSLQKYRNTTIKSNNYRDKKFN
jgi:hypothetical protein